MSLFNVLWTIFNLTRNFIYVHSKLGLYLGIFEKSPPPIAPDLRAAIREDKLSCFEASCKKARILINLIEY